MNTPAEIFCPVCKFKNEVSAQVCVHCQSPLAEVESRTTQRMPGITQLFDTDELIKNAHMPEDGVVILSQESGQEIAVNHDERFILGRTVEGVEETIIDLSAFGAYGLGVSRLHILVRKTVSGYEISDMDSTNGTWLNDEELVPNKFYPIASGSHIRMGKMQIIVLFRKNE
jgi:hypothetical protein